MPVESSSRLNELDVAVVGAGYVGLVTAACLARLGRRVTVLEIQPGRLTALRNGRVPFFEPGLQDLLDAGLRSGRITVEGEAATALAGRDAILVCVGTPLSDEGEADLSQVRNACRDIARHGGSATVVIRSTLPLGATPRVAAWLGGRNLGMLASNPEFLRQGTAVSDFLAPSRIVIGTAGGRWTPAGRLVRRLYSGIEAPVMVTDFVSADMIKNAANAFLATKLSFINEIADLCEAYGADIEPVVKGIGLDPRIGRAYLRPGIGFGGSCLPKELVNLMRLGRRRGLPVHLLHAASHENGGRAHRIAERLDRMAGGLTGRRVALLGLSFKPDTDDVRYSPALGLARALIERGALVTGHDPAVPLERTSDVSGLGRAASVMAACTGCELVVLATEWREYVELDWGALRSVVDRPLLFDGRDVLDADALRRCGWEVMRIGQRSAADVPDRSTAAGRPPAASRAPAAVA